MSTKTIDAVVEQLSTMPDNLQEVVLAFTQTLNSTTPKGVAGQKLLQFASIFSPDDLEAIQKAIEADCEQIDEHEW